MDVLKFDKDELVDKKVFAIKSTFFFAIILLVSLGCFHFIYQFQKKEARLNATYTAESAIRNIASQFGRYLENSNLCKNIISSGFTISDIQFADLAKFMKIDKTVIEAYELAPDGIISQVYPYEGNEEALGLNMFEVPERKKEAILAKSSGNYTIAGPFELKQGGFGALLLDPIYVGQDAERKFWGFSILVLNWENFLKELEIEKLSEANYHFDVWKKDSNGNRIAIMDCGHGKQKDVIQVSCTVPNDTWYFEIVPKNGWISMRLRILGYFLSFAIAIFVAIGYWQAQMRKFREIVYAKELEKSAKKAQEANEAKTRFLFNMSHDIRTPMNAIIGYSDLLKDKLDNKKVALDYIKKIRISNSMLLSLINYILEMARIESGKIILKQEKENLQDFVDMIRTVSQPMISEKKLECTWNLDVVHKNILCDTTRLREIVLNIVTNSIKYTAAGGKILLSIKELSSNKKDAADYRIVVSDNGIGMHEEYLPHIFEEFSREHTSTESKISGVGLGLPIVKSLVDMMHGKIEVESKLNVGTKFTIFITFPIIQGNEASEEKDAQNLEDSQNDQNGMNGQNGLKNQTEPNNLKGKKILLAEDNELNAEIAKEILKMQGISVDIAEDGKKCLEILEKMPFDYYDAILMDVQMPVMNGYDATQAIRNSKKPYAKIPIVAMTANAFEEDKEHAFAAGMNEHISKPINIENLKKVLNCILKKKECGLKRYF